MKLARQEGIAVGAPRVIGTWRLQEYRRVTSSDLRDGSRFISSHFTYSGVNRWRYWRTAFIRYSGSSTGTGKPPTCIRRAAEENGKTVRS